MQGKRLNVNIELPCGCVITRNGDVSGCRRGEIHAKHSWLPGTLCPTGQSVYEMTKPGQLPWETVEQCARGLARVLDTARAVNGATTHHGALADILREEGLPRKMAATVAARMTGYWGYGSEPDTFWGRIEARPFVPRVCWRCGRALAVDLRCEHCKRTFEEE